MNQLFLVPACDKEAKENMEKSLKRKVNLVETCRELSIRLEDIAVRGNVEGLSMVNVWGTKKDKKTIWSSVNPGDGILYYTSDGGNRFFRFYGTVAAIIDHPGLAGAIWQSEEFRYIHVCYETPEIHLDSRVVFEYLGYSMRWVQGFMRVSAKHWNRIAPGLRAMENLVDYMQELDEVEQGIPVETRAEIESLDNHQAEKMQHILKAYQDLTRKLADGSIDIPYQEPESPPEQIKKPVISFEPNRRTPDFLNINVVKAKRGELAEKIVHKLEKHALRTAGRQDLADQVRIVSEASNQYGYDVLSYYPDGKEKHIEVKSTTRGKSAPFEMTYREYERWQTEECYVIYRVFQFKVGETIQYRYYVLDHTAREKIKVEPLVYRVYYEENQTNG